MGTSHYRRIRKATKNVIGSALWTLAMARLSLAASDGEFITGPDTSSTATPSPIDLFAGPQTVSPLTANLTTPTVPLSEVATPDVPAAVPTAVPGVPTKLTISPKRGLETLFSLPDSVRALTVLDVIVGASVVIALGTFFWSIITVYRGLASKNPQKQAEGKQGATDSLTISVCSFVASSLYLWLIYSWFA